MFHDKSTFISYTRIPNLQVWMGNNSYLPVLGLGTPIISLNGQQVLVHHALHVPCPQCGGSSLQPSHSLQATRLRFHRYFGFGYFCFIFLFFSFRSTLLWTASCHTSPSAILPRWLPFIVFNLGALLLSTPPNWLLLPTRLLLLRM